MSNNCCCFVPKEEFSEYSGTFNAHLISSPLQEPYTFLKAFFCAPCFFYKLRKHMLRDDLGQYVCLNGYISTKCIVPGNCFEAQCPACCLCLEVTCCSGLSTSVTRTMIMHEYKLQQDCIDRNFFACNTFMQRISCCCVLCLGPFAEVLHYISNVGFCCIQSCMATQMVSYLRKHNAWPERPKAYEIVREESRKKRQQKIINNQPEE